MLALVSMAAALVSLLAGLLLLLTPVKGLAASASRRSHHCAHANLRPTRANAAIVDAATLCLIDRVRAAYRLRSLRSNHELQAVAGSQATGMVRHDYFGDDNSRGKTAGMVIEALPYGARARSLATAQNLGWGTSSAATPAGIVAAWMRSPPHRGVILSGEFREAGVGVSPAVPHILGYGSHGATYAVEFAARGERVHSRTGAGRAPDKRGRVHPVLG